jgi:hypothetical protein
MREQVLGEGTTCWICGGEGTPEKPLTPDRVLPRAHGGTNERTDYRAAHASDPPAIY